VVREETAWAGDGAGDAGCDGLVDWDGAGAAVVWRRIPIAIGAVAIAIIREVVTVVAAV
jgi:hypothetical protein